MADGEAEDFNERDQCMKAFLAAAVARYLRSIGSAAARRFKPLRQSKDDADIVLG